MATNSNQYNRLYRGQEVPPPSSVQEIINPYTLREGLQFGVMSLVFEMTVGKALDERMGAEAPIRTIVGGVLLHLALEATGVNQAYVKEGYARKRLDQLSSITDFYSNAPSYNSTLNQLVRDSAIGNYRTMSQGCGCGCGGKLKSKVYQYR